MIQSWGATPQEVAALIVPRMPGGLQSVVQSADSSRSDAYGFWLGGYRAFDMSASNGRKEADDSTQMMEDAFSAVPLHYYCRCTRENTVYNALMSVSEPQELASLLGETHEEVLQTPPAPSSAQSGDEGASEGEVLTSIQCNICNEQYDVTQNDVR